MIIAKKNYICLHFQQHNYFAISKKVIVTIHPIRSTVTNEDCFDILNRCFVFLNSPLWNVATL